MGYWVSIRSIVHRADGKCRGRYRHPWKSEHRFSFDRACHNCLPEGLPVQEAKR